MSMLGIILGRSLFTNGHAFKDLSLFFSQFKWVFLISHGLFYVALYLLWPKWVRMISHQKHLVLECMQITLAIKARIYLIAVLLIFELLNLMR